QGPHAGRAAKAHVHPFIRSSGACHRRNFKGEFQQGQLRIDKHTELDMRHAVLSYRAVREPAIVS
ncbi:hypothetical protein KUCAC02_015817, partial [Chaenocephalus aceratus]